MRQICTTVYQYDELSDAAKETARDWFSQSVFSDSNDWDHVYEDVAAIADMIGINLRQRAVKLMNGSTRMEPEIYFSGFSSQGDGACFKADYAYKTDSVKAVTEHAPNDAELHRIVTELADIQQRFGNHVTATCRPSGRGYHSRSMDIEVDFAVDFMDGGPAPDDVDEEQVRQLLRDFADWIYRQLASEYEYQTSEEAVAENIRANEYEFTADGKRA